MEIKKFTRIILSKTSLLAFFSFGKEEKGPNYSRFPFFVFDIQKGTPTVGQAVICEVP